MMSPQIPSDLLTCCTAVIRAKSSVGFHLPRSFVEAGAGAWNMNHTLYWTGQADVMLVCTFYEICGKLENIPKYRFNNNISATFFITVYIY